MPSALLLAALLAPPAGGDAAADDPWAARTLPTLSFGFPPTDGGRWAAGATVAALVRLDPTTVAGFPVEGNLAVTFSAPGADGRIRQIVGVKIPLGGEVTGLTVSPPQETGWGPGSRLILSAELESLPQVRAYRILNLTPAGPAGPPPAEPVDRGTLIDANAADARPAAALIPRERFRVRGTFRAPAADPPRPSAVLVSLKVGEIIAGSDIAPAFPEGSPDEDGATLHWFETELIAPARPGEYRLELAPRTAAGGFDGPAAFPPLTVTVSGPDAERS